MIKQIDAQQNHATAYSGLRMVAQPPRCLLYRGPSKPPNLGDYAIYSEATVRAKGYNKL